MTMVQAGEIVRDAVKLGACSYFHDENNLEHLLSKFYDVPVWEFCTGNNYPPLSVWGEVGKDLLLQNNMFVDSGKINLTNQKHVVLVGDTEAELSYSGGAEKYIVYLLHGAKAKIQAGGYSVVFVKSATGTMVEKRATGNAVIL